MPSHSATVRAGRSRAHEVADGGERQAAIAELGDEGEALEVIVAVDGVAPVLRRLRQQPLRLVPADRADRQPAAVGELLEAVRRGSSGLGRDLRSSATIHQ